MTRKKRAAPNRKHARASTIPIHEESVPEIQYQLDTVGGPQALRWTSLYSISATIVPAGSSQTLPSIIELAGSLNARFVCKNDIRAHFWQEMQHASVMTATLASDLFDRYGCLREEFLEGSKRGTGVWGREMNEKCLALIETVKFTPEWEGKGVLEQMFMRLFDHATHAHETATLMIIHPNLVTQHATGASPELLAMWSVAARIEFLRKIGYRRVGASEWFAKAFDDEHPSRTLSISDDYDPIKSEETELEQLQAKCELTRTQSSTNRVLTDISDAFRGFETETIIKLLQLQGLQHPYTTQQIARAKFGCTCGQCMEGFISPRMLFALQKQSDRAYKQLRSDMMSDHIRQSLFTEPGLLKKKLVGTVWSCCARAMQMTFYMSKDVAVGYAYVFYYIARLFKNGNLPILSKLRKDIQDSTLDFEDDPCECCGLRNNGSPQALIRIFLNRGGTARSCLEGVFALTMGMDEKAGDDTFHWPQLRTPGWNFAKQYKAMPRCRNDSEFGMVLGMLLEK